MEKKRYILFAFDTYYASGGMNDARVSFNEDEYNEMKKTWEDKHGYDWFQIFDTETFKTYEAEKGEIPKIN